jgi:hypothetical protein
MKEPIHMGTDKMIPRHVYDKPFIVRFSDRSEWKDRFHPNREGGLVWYTDVSKTNEGTGAGGVWLWYEEETSGMYSGESR